MTRAPEAAAPPRTSGLHGLAWTRVGDGAGRVLVASLFLYSGWFDMATHWPSVVDVVAARGLPVPALLAGGAMTLEIAASLLLFVPRTRAGATAALAVYCMATALLFHTDWLYDPGAIDAGFHFFKNMALAGALLTTLIARRATDGGQP